MTKDTGLIYDKDELLERLLCYGLFPERIPPMFSSEQYGKYAYNLIKSQKYNYNKNLKFNHISHPLTKEIKPRLLNIPNFYGYTALCYLLYLHWDKITENFNKNWIFYNPNMIRMQKKHRLFSMSTYDDSEINKANRLVNMGKTCELNDSYTMNLMVGQKYKIHLDISKFYNSVYAHAISWALITKKKAKELFRNQNAQKAFIKKNFDYTCIENQIMNMQDKESFGIPIGPDTSYILADILLSKIDFALFKKKFKFIRYIDDFYFYAKSEEELDNFIDELRKQLYVYKLCVNDEKTEITKLPAPVKVAWINEIDNYTLPSLKDKNFITKIIYFLDLGVKHSSEYGSRVIKYCMNYISNKYKNAHFVEKDLKILYDYFFHLIFLHPYLVSCLDNLLKNIPYKNSLYLSDRLQELIKNNIKSSRYDIITWSLYVAMINYIKIDLSIFIRGAKRQNFIVKDCLCLTALLQYIKKCDNLSLYAKVFHNFYYKELKLKTDDEFWLLEYELFNLDIISNLNKLPQNIDTKIQQKYDEKQRVYAMLKNKKISFIKM